MQSVSIPHAVDGAAYFQLGFHSLAANSAHVGAALLNGHAINHGFDNSMLD